MAYKRITVMDIYEIIRRWHDQQSTSHIAIALNNDRKTVRKYIAVAKARGLSPFQLLPAKDIVIDLLHQAIPKNNRVATAQEILERFLPEITGLINDKYNSLKPKIAFEVICEKYDITGKVSYSSFKNFVRNHQIVSYPEKSTCRIEVPPGSQVQIDYGKDGYLFDPKNNKPLSNSHSKAFNLCGRWIILFITIKTGDYYEQPRTTKATIKNFETFRTIGKS